MAKKQKKKRINITELTRNVFVKKSLYYGTNLNVYDKYGRLHNIQEDVIYDPLIYICNKHIFRELNTFERKKYLEGKLHNTKFVYPEKEKQNDKINYESLVNSDDDYDPIVVVSDTEEDEIYF